MYLCICTCVVQPWLSEGFFPPDLQRCYSYAQTQCINTQKDATHTHTHAYTQSITPCRQASFIPCNSTLAAYSRPHTQSRAVTFKHTHIDSLAHTHAQIKHIKYLVVTCTLTYIHTCTHQPPTFASARRRQSTHLEPSIMLHTRGVLYNVRTTRAAVRHPRGQHLPEFGRLFPHIRHRRVPEQRLPGAQRPVLRGRAAPAHSIPARLVPTDRYARAPHPRTSTHAHIRGLRHVLAPLCGRCVRMGHCHIRVVLRARCPGVQRTAGAHKKRRFDRCQHQQ